jgi:predicted outer membrane protein
MARGFDSKFVEAQQEEATREKFLRPPTTPAQREREARRQALQMSRNRAEDDLRRATAPAHKRMLEQAIEALDGQLASLDPGTSNESA